MLSVAELLTIADPVVKSLCLLARPDIKLGRLGWPICGVLGIEDAGVRSPLSTAPSLLPLLLSLKISLSRPSTSVTIDFRGVDVLAY